MKIAKERLHELIENELAMGKVKFLKNSEAMSELRNLEYGYVIVSFLKNRQQIEDRVGMKYSAYRFFDEKDILNNVYYEDGNIQVNPVLISKKSDSELIGDMEFTRSYIIIKVDESDLIQEQEKLDEPQN